MLQKLPFLAKGPKRPFEDRHMIPWDEKERSLGQMETPEGMILVASCARGVWDGLYAERIEATLDEIIDKDRKDDCFFLEYSEAMLFDGAKELHRIRYDNRHLKKSFRIAATGLYISALAASLNFIGVENLKRLGRTIIEWLGM